MGCVFLKNLADGLAAEAARAEAEASLLGDAEKSLRAACKLPTPEGELPRPGDQLRALQAFVAPPDFPTDLMNGLLARTEDEIVAVARERFDGALAEGLPDAATTQGDVLACLRAWGFVVSPESTSCTYTEPLRSLKAIFSESGDHVGS